MLLSEMELGVAAQDYKSSSDHDRRQAINGLSSWQPNE
jgi:hypothetical protein